VVGHEGQREGRWKGDGRGEGYCKEIDHWDRESSKDQRDDAEVPFRFGERIELVCEDEEEGRMKIRRILFVKFYLVFEVISGVIEGMDFIHPEGLLIEGVEPQDKAYKEAENQDQEFFLFWGLHSGNNFTELGFLFNWHIDPFLFWRMRIPEKEIHRSIGWKSAEIKEASVKIPLQNTGGTLLDLFRGPFAYDNP